MMRNVYRLLGLAFSLATAPAYGQAPTWASGAQNVNSTPTDDTGSVGMGIALDAAGNQYVAGVLQSGAGSGMLATRAFGSTSLSSQGFNIASGFVAKLSPAMQWQWAVRAGSNGMSVALRQAAPSPAGDVYVAGTVEDDPNSRPSGGTLLSFGSLTYTTTAPQVMFVSRLNAAGQPQWIAPAPNASVVAVGWDAAAGNVVVAGGYRGTAVFGSTPLPAAPYGGAYVARLNTAGVWVSAVGVAASGTATTRDFTVTGAAVGPQGQVAVVGNLTTASASFGATTLTASGTGPRAVVAQLSPAGTWQWALSGAGTQATQAKAAAYAPSGDVWVVGSATAGAQLGSTTVSSSFGATSAFVSSISAAGTWGTVASVGDVTAQTVTSDNAGNAVALFDLGIGTAAPGTYTFGSQTFTAAGRRPAVARVTPAGVWQYAVPGPVVGNSSVASNTYSLQAAALDASGSLYATGFLRSGPLVLGSSTLTGTLFGNSSTANFGGDALVAKLSSAGALLAVRPAAGPASLALYPNPAAGAAGATLRLGAAAPAPTPVTVRDATGRAVGHAVWPAGAQEFFLATAGLAPGLYTVETGPGRAKLVVQ